MAIIALVLVVLFHAGGCAAIRGGAAANGDVDFIRASCGSTTYPRLCFESLSAHASTIQRSPVMLATAALSVSMDSAEEASAAMAGMARKEKMNPREAAAVKDCMDTLSDSVAEIRRAIAEMSYLRKRDRNLGFHISNIQTWVSAALTDERTCVEGFSEAAMNSPVKLVARNHVINVAHQTSNALALIAALVAPSP